MANQLQGYAKPLKMPVWRGENLIGKTITIVAEQGFGDIVQYARFLPFLKVIKEYLNDFRLIFRLILQH